MNHGHHENLQPSENILKGNQGDRGNSNALVRGVFEGGKDSVQVLKDLGTVMMDKVTNAPAHERAEHYKALLHDLNKVCQEHVFKDRHTHVIGVSIKGGERGLVVEDAKGNVMRVNANGESELLGTHDARGKFVPAKHEKHDSHAKHENHDKHDRQDKQTSHDQHSSHDQHDKHDKNANDRSKQPPPPPAHLVG